MHFGKFEFYCSRILSKPSTVFFSLHKVDMCRIVIKVFFVLFPLSAENHVTLLFEGLMTGTCREQMHTMAARRRGGWPLFNRVGELRVAKGD